MAAGQVDVAAERCGVVGVEAQMQRAAGSVVGPEIQQVIAKGVDQRVVESHTAGKHQQQDYTGPVRAWGARLMLSSRG